jgi:hypothetical protein
MHSRGAIRLPLLRVLRGVPAGWSELVL